MAKFGCLLMILAMAVLCVWVVLPVLPFTAETTTFDDLLRPLVCQPNENIERDLYTTSGRRGGTTFTMSVFCLDQEGNRREETGRWMIFGMVGFVVPFLIGLFGLIGGVSRNAAKMVSTAAVTFAEQGLSSAFPTVSATGKSLSERLKEIQETRDAGLITEEEYQRLRQEILDSQS